MDRLDTVRQEVEKLYTGEQKDADPWVYWGYPNHILIAGKEAEQLAKQHNANVGFAVAGALLHDIGDAIMRRNNPEHETTSLQIASDILQRAGYSEDDIKTITSDIIKPHSCNKLMPETLEAKIVATADAIAHVGTDYYIFFCWFPDKHIVGYDGYKKWVAEKIERDFYKKIFFDDVRARLKPQYEALKLLLT